VTAAFSAASWLDNSVDPRIVFDDVRARATAPVALIQANN
jgi:hypothetical protein